MDYTRKIIRCNDVREQTTESLEKILRKGLGEKNLRIEWSGCFGFGNNELEIKGIYKEVHFAIYLNREDETLFMEIYRQGDKPFDEASKKAFEELKTVVEDRIFPYESLLNFNAEYIQTFLRDNGVQKVKANKFVALWVNISDPKLENSNYLDIRFSTRYNKILNAWHFEKGNTGIKNLQYNPKYSGIVGKIDVLEELCKNASERKPYLREFRDCGIKKENSSKPGRSKEL